MEMKLVSLLLVGHLLFVLTSGGVVTDGGRRVVCYFGGKEKNIIETLAPEDIDPTLCTHLVYLNAVLSIETNEIVPQNATHALYDNGGEGLYNRTVKLKEINPQLKVLLHVFPRYNGDVIPSSGRENFIKSAVAIVKNNGFDGLDFDKSILMKEDRKKPNIELLSELRTEFNKQGFLISTTFPRSGFPIYAADDLDVIIRTCDFIIVRTIDYWGPQFRTTGLYAPLPQMISTMESYFAVNVPPEKILIMIPAYGMIAQMVDVNNTELGSPAIAAVGYEKETSIFSFIIFYRTLVERFGNQSEEWRKYRDEASKAPYAINRYGLWVSYEDTVSVSEKARYVVQNKLGGAAISFLDIDDFIGTGGEGRFPLTRALSNIIMKGQANGNCSSENNG